MRVPAVPAVALLLAACAHPSASHGLRAIDPARLEATTRTLSSDEMAGRAPGTPGGARAEEYVAEQFRAMGLEPAGDGGTFFQTVPLLQATRVDAESSLVVHTRAGDVTPQLDRELLLFGSAQGTDIAIDAPLVFAGYGIGRPELGYDDLEGVDVRGKVALVFGGSPRSVGGRPLDAALHAVLAARRPRAEGLRDRGAIAVVEVYDPVLAERLPFTVLAPKLGGPTLTWLEGDRPGNLAPLPVVMISAPAFDRILAAIPGAPQGKELWKVLDQGGRQTLDVGASVSLRIRSTHARIAARNVLARLPGTDASETVVYSAHLDHVGVGDAVGGDKIYNGALDNAIGVAAILEVAHAFVALGRKPRRSILFAAVTAEEAGLIGSSYLVHHSPVPLDQIVADLNVDGLTPYYEVHDIVALGAEHSTLARPVAEAARQLGLAVSPDPDPAEVSFIRSDQFSFVREGVPSIFAAAGFLDAKGGSASNRALVDAWTEQRYHQPSDEWQADYRAEWTLPETRFHFLVGLFVADAAERPRWNAGDVFATFAKKAP